VRDDLTPGPDESLDRLVGDWRLFQLQRGHRFSSDDLLTAWTAVQAFPGAKRLLDLGSGIGSVGLMALWHMAPSATLRMVEVQEISWRLAERTVALNQLGARVQPTLGDLRDPDAVPENHAYDLVTGSPPYIPLGKGVVSPHPQRAGARMELKGDIFDYAVAAARSLRRDPLARFCFCHMATDTRPEPAVRAAGLSLLSRQVVVFRQGRAPLIALFTCGWSGERIDPAPLVVRSAEGVRTATYDGLLRSFGAPG
jgi:tRNA1(Val) A37 N6-methylase TrmN6